MRERFLAFLDRLGMPSDNSNFTHLEYGFIIGLFATVMASLYMEDSMGALVGGIVGTLFGIAKEVADYYYPTDEKLPKFDKVDAFSTSIGGWLGSPTAWLVILTVKSFTL